MRHRCNKQNALDDGQASRGDAWSQLNPKCNLSRLSQAGADPAASVLQPGRRQLAAGYALFSSATLLVLTLGRGTHGFTLDPRSGEFVLTHPNIGIPSRGQLYSLNDGRYHDWPAGLQVRQRLLRAAWWRSMFA